MKNALEIMSPLGQTAITGVPNVRAKCWAEFRSACLELESLQYQPFAIIIIT